MAQIAAAHAAFVNHRGKKRSTLEFFDFAFGLMPPHLLVERVQ